MTARVVLTGAVLFALCGALAGALAGLGVFLALALKALVTL